MIFGINKIQRSIQKNINVSVGGDWRRVRCYIRGGGFNDLEACKLTIWPLDIYLHNNAWLNAMSARK